MFLNYLKEHKLEWLIQPPKPKKILPRNAHRVYLKVMQAIQNNEYIWIEPDCDPDGFFSAKCWQYTFDKLGYQRYKIGKLSSRRHKVSKSKMESVLAEGFTTIILVDSSTNEVDLIDMICNYRTPSGKEVQLLILDHHNGKYSWDRYPENCTLVNPKLEPSDLPYYEVSAGVVNAMVCDYILFRNGYQRNRELDIFGYLTMYSDNCAVADPYMAGYMRTIMNNNSDIPSILQIFWDDFSAMNRNFISFKVVPLINALIRMNEFDMVDQLFFHTHEIADKNLFLNQIMEIKKQSAEVVEYLMSIMEVMILDDTMVVGRVPSLLDQKYYNFLGFVAMKLADKYKKIALCVYLDPNTDMFVGSARDYLNRDILSQFTTFFEDSAGHDSAFGVVIDRSKLHIVQEIISKESLEEKIDFVDFNHKELTTNKEIYYMAIYNEMAINKIPKARLKINITGDFSLGGNTKRSTATNKDITIVAFGQPIERYREYICEPSFNGGRVECIIQSK